MRNTLLAFAALLLPLTSFAQISILSFNQKGGGFYVQGGTYSSNVVDQYNALKLDAVTFKNGEVDVAAQRRNPVAYPLPKKSFLTFGIGGYGISSSIIYGGEINGYLGSGVSGSYIDTTLPGGAQAAEYKYTLKTSTYGVDGMATLGVVVLRLAGLVVKPTIGFGYGGMAIQISDNREVRQYPSYTTGNQENKILWNAGFLYDLGLGADYHLSGFGDKAKGLKFGIKFGYRAQSAGTWMERGNQLVVPNTTAKLGNSGPYIRLSIGVGSCGKAKD